MGAYVFGKPLVFSLLERATRRFEILTVQRIFEVPSRVYIKVKKTNL